jgi:salicylate hydroxylase
MSRTVKNIGIIGAGIGGLTAAVALRRRGHNVTIFEQACGPGEIGAGIIVGPNAVKVLRALDLEADVSRIAVEPDRHLLRNWRTGRVLFNQRMKGVFADKFDAGYMQVHRADLIDALFRHVPSECVSFGRTVVAVSSHSRGAVVELSGGLEKEFDMVVGADGIKSIVRTSLFGPESPRFTGNVCWRGTVPTSDLPAGLFSSDTHVWIGPNAHVVNYFIRGGELMNFVAILEADEWRSEAWSFDGDRQELVQAFSGWNSSLPTMFERATHCLKWALFDRDPLPEWSKGRIALLGDAAHPMLPHLAQGAAMAMEDGYILAAMLESESDIEVAFERYQAIRHPRTTRTQLGARVRAKENHLTSPLSRFIRDAKYTVRRLFRPTSYAVEWLYAYDVRKVVG